VFIQIIHKHPGISNNNCHDIVKIMTVTPRQLANGFHLLRLSKLFFQLINSLIPGVAAYRKMDLRR
jgi:hypothetical protein